MTKQSDLRDELARLIDVAWESPRENLIDHHQDAADAILSRFKLVPKDSVVVPVEPTEAMLRAGHQKIDWCGIR